MQVLLHIHRGRGDRDTRAHQIQRVGGHDACGAGNSTGCKPHECMQLGRRRRVCFAAPEALDSPFDNGTQCPFRGLIDTELHGTVRRNANAVDPIPPHKAGEPFLAPDAAEPLPDACIGPVAALLDGLYLPAPGQRRTPSAQTHMMTARRSAPPREVLCTRTLQPLERVDERTTRSARCTARDETRPDKRMLVAVRMCILLLTAAVGRILRVAGRVLAARPPWHGWC